MAGSGVTASTTVLGPSGVFCYPSLFLKCQVLTSTSNVCTYSVQQPIWPARLLAPFRSIEIPQRSPRASRPPGTPPFRGLRGHDHLRAHATLHACTPVKHDTNPRPPVPQRPSQQTLTMEILARGLNEWEDEHDKQCAATPKEHKRSF